MNNTTIHIAEYTFAFDETKGVLLDAHGKIVPADVQKISEGEYSVIVQGRSYHLFLTGNRTEYLATVNNFVFDVRKETLRDRLSRQLQKDVGVNTSAVTLRAPMPGMVTKLMKNEGEQVNAGEGIMVVEAMKMENEIKAQKTGILKKIFVKVKHTVEKNDSLFTIE